jgi:hypothetical protein
VGSEQRLAQGASEARDRRNPGREHIMTDRSVAVAPARRGVIDRFLDVVERIGNALPDPTTLFAMLAVAVVVISAFGSYFRLVGSG